MSFEPPEAGHPPHHGTGHRWLDIALAASAMLVSVISLFVAISHGKVMEEMVDANKKMVAASSWPYLQFTNTIDIDSLASSLDNRGVGPARIKTFEWLVDGTPIATWRDLMTHCCADALSSQGGKLSFTNSSVAGQVLPAREKINVFTLKDTQGHEKMRLSLIASVSRMERRVCYCSVFGECWRLSTAESGDPKPVPSCPEIKVPFVGYEEAELYAGVKPIR